jgi:hypothetical protein
MKKMLHTKYIDEIPPYQTSYAYSHQIRNILCNSSASPILKTILTKVAYFQELYYCANFEVIYQMVLHTVAPAS